MSSTAENTSSTIVAELVLASDLHIRDLDDERGRLLLDLIARVDGKTAYFVLNGDIFDFYFGYGAYFRTKYARLTAALQQLAQRGTTVIIIEGNHEFHLSAAGWQNIEIVTNGDLLLTLPSGTRVKVNHGDLLYDDRLYAAFRGLIKSRLVRTCARALPGAWLDAYAMRHAAISRSRDQYRKLNHQRVLTAFSRWLATPPHAHHGIIGHYHVPYAEPHTNGGLMLSVESWDSPSILVYRHSTFWRANLREVGAPFVFDRTKPLHPTS